MDNPQSWKKIKYESELDLGFASEISALPGGEKLLSCIQCGTCSGTCPVSPYMDFTPRRIIAMIRAGFKHEVLTSVTTWLCASCYSCSVECPQGIDITNVMYALKRRAILETVYPDGYPVSVLTREFFKSVRRSGRNSEGRLSLKLLLKTRPLALLRQGGLGLGLWSQGRLRFGREKIKDRKGLRRLLKAVEVRFNVEKAAAVPRTKVGGAR